MIFTESEGSVQSSGTLLTCQRYQSWLVAPLPTRLLSNLSAAEVKAGQQATLNGLSLDTRRSLLTLAAQNAVNGAGITVPCSGKILLLGGNLAYSAWGEPFSAQAAMEYIAGHPWIRVLRPEDLLGNQPSGSWEAQALPANPINQASTLQQGNLTSPLSIPGTPGGKPILSGLSVAQLQGRLLADLQTAPPGPLANAAWQMYTSLIAPEFPLSSTLYPLRAAYLAQVGYWLAADEWASDPLRVCVASGQSPCAYTQDINWDGEPEYILASSTYFGVFDRRGGYLAAAFAVDQNGPHQIVGPSWQFSVGQSDPSVWDASQGIAGDPRAERGAFSEIPAGYAGPSWEPYSVQIGQGELSFTSPDNRLHKTIRLTEQGFSAQYESEDQVKVQVPLVLDPWDRFSPGWEQRYTSSATNQTTDLHDWIWSLEGGVQVELTTASSSLSVQPFTITQKVMSAPENPDYQFPLGSLPAFPHGACRGDWGKRFYHPVGH